jgi:hypothetical protein
MFGSAFFSGEKKKKKLREKVKYPDLSRGIGN